MPIREIGAIFVPVADQERALAFYVDVLGFEKRADFGYGGGIRWIEVAPPVAANTITLVPPGEGAAARSDTTVCAFATDDIEADHVDVLVPDPVPAQCCFRDLGGNRYLLVQPGLSPYPSKPSTARRASTCQGASARNSSSMPSRAIGRAKK